MKEYTISSPTQQITKSRDKIAKYASILNDGLSQVTMSCTYSGLWIMNKDPMKVVLIQCSRDEARDLVLDIAPAMVAYPNSHPEGIEPIIINSSGHGIHE